MSAALCMENVDEDIELNEFLIQQEIETNRRLTRRLSIAVDTRGVLEIRRSSHVSAEEIRADNEGIKRLIADAEAFEASFGIAP